MPHWIARTRSRLQITWLCDEEVAPEVLKAAANAVCEANPGLCCKGWASSCRAYTTRPQRLEFASARNSWHPSLRIPTDAP
mmetsp:Transcript_37936/g.104718  ORF Transcript_37936/g.104718 Transcript_37936/m.104718 type:complete len:81 (-) Transcript_37936:512-754(-)